MEAPKAEFNVEETLREILNDGKDFPSIFDRLLLKFENFSERPVSSLGDLKRRDNKRAKGLGWEKFCQFYLVHVMGYCQVWLWNEIPDDVRVALNLKSRVDNGIDIVARQTIHSGYMAVQCKYRKRTDQTVTWTTLSTFVGLCAQTGPWERHVVMTNCKGVSRRTGIPKTAKDKTIAYGTFSKLSKEQCAPIHNIKDPSNYQSLTDKMVSLPKTQEDLRAARLARFSNQ